MRYRSIMQGSSLQWGERRERVQHGGHHHMRNQRDEVQVDQTGV